MLTVVCNSMVLVIHDQKGVYNEEENEKITSLVGKISTPTIAVRY